MNAIRHEANDQFPTSCPTTVSVPRPLSTVSMPRPPSSLSLPSPAVRKSFPVPPLSVLLPSPPSRVTERFDNDASNESLPAPPLSVIDETPVTFRNVSRLSPPTRFSNESHLNSFKTLVDVSLYCRLPTSQIAVTS